MDKWVDGQTKDRQMDQTWTDRHKKGDSKGQIGHSEICSEQ